MKAELRGPMVLALVAIGLWPVISTSADIGDASGSAAQIERWQERRLFTPTPAELAQDRSGTVFIYEGLTDRQVERAMEDAFDRVESMMFIRTIVTDDKGEAIKDPETGTALVFDDDC